MRVRILCVRFTSDLLLLCRRAKRAAETSKFAVSCPQIIFACSLCTKCISVRKTKEKRLCMAFLCYMRNYMRTIGGACRRLNDCSNNRLDKERVCPNDWRTTEQIAGLVRAYSACIYAHLSYIFLSLLFILILSYKSK